MIPRILTQTISEILQKGLKNVILYGPRQAGKTTLIRNIIPALSGKTLQLTGENLDDVTILTSQSLTRLSALVQGYTYVFVDEAHKIPHFATSLKLLIDHHPSHRFIITGSNALELRDRARETLAGRAYTFELLPIWTGELNKTITPHELHAQLPTLLRYGMYPAVLQAPENLRTLELKSIMENNLLKDTLYEQSVEKELLMRQLLRLLAFQIGGQISYTELAQKIGISVPAVQGFIDALERSFILFRLGGYARNLRKETIRNPKIYFYDVGIRNAVLGNFNPLSDRDDVGQLWENFLIAERQKKLLYQSPLQYHSYFWRTYTGAEIDYIEESATSLHGYELKWGACKKAPHTWGETYPHAQFTCVNQDNWQGFVNESG